MSRVTPTSAVGLLLFATIALAQKSVPEVDYLFPAGMQRGTSTKIKLHGRYLPDTSSVHVSNEAVTPSAIADDQHSTVTASDAATYGTHLVRVKTIQGVSLPRPFVVGRFPELIEAEAADEQSVSLPTTFNGRIDVPNDIDTIRFKLAPGEQVVCSLAAQSIGSAFDATLRLRDTNGNTLAINNGYRGLDPLISYRSKVGGEYLLDVHEFNMKGTSAYVYRLTLTTGPFIDGVFPTAIQRGEASTVRLSGWNVDPNLTISPKSDQADHLINLPSRDPVHVSIKDSPQAHETESKSLEELVLNTTIHGRFDQPGDIDRFTFPVTEKELYVVEVESASLGFPTDAVLHLAYDDGKLIREVDDFNRLRDPAHTFRATATGTVIATLSDRANRSGPDYIYRITLRNQTPDFRLTTAKDTITASLGSTATAAINIDRRDNFREPLEFTVEGLPPGITVDGTSVDAAKSAAANLKFTIDESVPFGCFPIRITARTTRESDNLTRPVTAPIAIRQTTFTTQTETLWLSIAPKIPYKMDLDNNLIPSPYLAGSRFPIHIIRDEGFTAPIHFTGYITRPDRSLITWPITIDSTVTHAPFPIMVRDIAVEGHSWRTGVMATSHVQHPSGTKHEVFQLAELMVVCGSPQMTLDAAPTELNCPPDTASTQSIRLQVKHLKDGIGPTKVSILPTPNATITAPTITITDPSIPYEIPVTIGKDTDLPTTIKLRAESTRDGLPVQAIATIHLR